jgi:hypothetical protein
MRRQRSRSRIAWFAWLLAAVGVVLLSTVPGVGADGRGDGRGDRRGDDPPPTEADLRVWLKTYSNWGRWNNDLGAANYITAKKRKDAARLVREGVSVGLAHPLLDVPFDPVLPFIPAFPSIAPMPTVSLDPDNGNPFFHWMNPPSYTSDRYNVSYHGVAHSRWRRSDGAEYRSHRRPTQAVAGPRWGGATGGGELRAACRWRPRSKGALSLVRLPVTGSERRDSPVISDLVRSWPVLTPVAHPSPTSSWARVARGVPSIRLAASSVRRCASPGRSNGSNCFSERARPGARRAEIPIDALWGRA